MTGIGYYTLCLIRALETIDDISISVFTLGSSDRLSRQLEPIAVHSANRNQKLYRKLHQFGLAVPFDKNLPHTDITIFPDFAAWPTHTSRRSAVVIHDLTFIKHPEYMRARTLGKKLRLPVTTWYLSSVVRRAVKDVDFIITVSNSIKADLISLLNIDPKKIIVTPIPPSDDFLSLENRTTTKEALRQKYAIPTDKYILSVGTIEPRKNQQATLRAYLKLPKKLRSIYTLVFAGGYGWNSDDFLSEVEKAKHAGENIVTTGYFDFEDSYDLYHYASLFTAASFYEGFGMPLMEAMAAGTPLLVADIPVFREVAENAAVYTNVSDPYKYASSIELLLSNPTLRSRLVEYGSARKNIYSWHKNAENIVKYFRASLKKN